VNEAILSVRVTPRASRNRLVVDQGDVRIYVTAAPVDGEANAAVIEALAKAMRIGKSSLLVVAGHSSRQKTIRIVGLSADEVWRRLGTA